MGNKLFRSRSHYKYEVNSEYNSEREENSSAVTYIQTEVLNRFDSSASVSVVI